MPDVSSDKDAPLVEGMDGDSAFRSAFRELAEYESEWMHATPVRADRDALVRRPFRDPRVRQRPGPVILTTLDHRCPFDGVVER